MNESTTFRYRSFWLTLPLVLTMLLGACGGSASPSSAPAAPSSAAASAKPAASAAPASAKPAASTQASAKPAASGAASAKPAASGAASGAAKPAASGSAAAKPAASIKVGYASPQANSMPFWVASETGLWQKNGLNAESILVEGSPKTVAALLGGDIQFALVGSAASVTSNLNGADLELIATAAPGLSFRIYAKPGINSVADLKGKGIAISTIGTDPDFALRLILPKYNVNYSDIKVVQFPSGGDPSRLAGIQAGQADAAVLSPGSFGVAEKEFGLHQVLDLAKENLQYEQATIAVSRKWATSHTDEMNGFLKTFSQSIANIQANKDATLPVLKKYLKTDSDQIVNEAYEGNNVLKVKGLPYVSEPGVQSVIDLLAESEPKAKGHKASEYVDNSWLKKLEDSGFKA